MLTTPKQKIATSSESDEQQAKNKLNSSIFNNRLQSFENRHCKQINYFLFAIIMCLIIRDAFGKFNEQSNRLNQLQSQINEMKNDQEKMSTRKPSIKKEDFQKQQQAQDANLIEQQKSEIKDLKVQNNDSLKTIEEITRNIDLLQKRLSLVEDELKNSRVKLNKEINNNKSLCDIISAKCYKQGSVLMNYQQIWVCGSEGETLYNDVCSQQLN